MPNTISQRAFGRLSDGTEVRLFELTSTTGLRVGITNFGGIITSIFCPDRSGEFANVVLGFESILDYETDANYIGALLGRYANRIDGATFTINGISYALSSNENESQLHGGQLGLNKVIWSATPNDTGDGLTLQYHSRDGDQGYPGNLSVKVHYQLRENELTTTFEAETDKATHFNPSQHSFFNLSGTESDILSHELQILAGNVTPVNENLIPTGAFTSVDGTPFDFRRPKAIGADIDATHEQLRVGNGYDINYVLEKEREGAFERCATAHDPVSGRTLEVFTTEPGLQFYSGNFLGTRKHKRRTGFCLEPQHFPNSPNMPQFPSTLLRPEQKFVSQMSYLFGVVT